jgi:SET domain-containing protein
MTQPDREIQPPSSNQVTETGLVLFHESKIHGTGGFAKTFICRGSRIIQYLGEKIVKRESLRRCEANNQYIFTLNAEFDLDGNVPWNPARLLNHSCAPNCEAELLDGQIWISAIRDIQANEELTFNYGFDLDDYKGYPCACGVAECVGFIVAEEFFPHLRKQKALEESARNQSATS